MDNKSYYESMLADPHTTEPMRVGLRHLHDKLLKDGRVKGTAQLLALIFLTAGNGSIIIDGGDPVSLTPETFNLFIKHLSILIDMGVSEEMKISILNSFVGPPKLAS